MYVNLPSVQDVANAAGNTGRLCLQKTMTHVYLWTKMDIVMDKPKIASASNLSNYECDTDTSLGSTKVYEYWISVVADLQKASTCYNSFKIKFLWIVEILFFFSGIFNYLGNKYYEKIVRFCLIYLNQI